MYRRAVCRDVYAKKKKKNPRFASRAYSAIITRIQNAKARLKKKKRKKTGGNKGEKKERNVKKKERKGKMGAHDQLKYSSFSFNCFSYTTTMNSEVYRGYYT